MTGHRKFNDLAHKATPAQIADARAEQSKTVALHELRKAMGFTQTQMASSLGMTQPGVSRIEGQTDLLLSTLRSYVNALGGDLELRARFADDEVAIFSLVELERDLETA